VEPVSFRPTTRPDALVDRATAVGLRGQSLSVADANDVARGMYVREGFAVADRRGASDTMVRTFT